VKKKKKKTKLLIDREETKMYKESGQLTVRRKGVQLFHYKYYKEQSPLNLTEEERQEVYNAVTNSDDHESCLIGSKILIKVRLLFIGKHRDKALTLILVVGYGSFLC